MKPGHSPAEHLEPVEVKVQEANMQDVAVCAIYLMQGYESLNALRDRNLDYLPTQDTSGHTGLAYRFAELALMMEVERITAPHKDHPGIIEYDVHEPMGRWFYAYENDNDLGCSTALFMAEYRAQLKNFFEGV